jgi:hypothetical protein
MPDTSQSIPPLRRQAISVEAPSPIAVSPKQAGMMLNYGQTSIFKLMKSGELKSFVDGNARRILVASIHDYIARKIEADGVVNRGPGRPRKATTT